MPATPGLPVGTDVFVDPAARPVKPEVPVAKLEVPVTVDPAHGVVMLLGAGMPIMGLTPALPISVEPRGIVPPLSIDAALMPGLDNGDAIPVDGVRPDAVGAQLPDVDVPIPVVPPPSKVELAPVAADPACPGASIPEEDMPVVKQLEPLTEEPTGAGLKPPGSISVAPSGIPVGKLEEVEPGMPSGDVTPRPGVPIVLWASAGALLNKSTAASTNNRRIDTSCRSPLGK
jgi:hypothetical protein